MSALSALKKSDIGVYFHLLFLFRYFVSFPPFGCMWAESVDHILLLLSGPTIILSSLHNCNCLVLDSCCLHSAKHWISVLELYLVCSLLIKLDSVSKNSYCLSGLFICSFYFWWKCLTSFFCNIVSFNFKSFALFFLFHCTAFCWRWHVSNTVL